MLVKVEQGKYFLKNTSNISLKLILATYMYCFVIYCNVSITQIQIEPIMFDTSNA